MKHPSFFLLLTWQCSRASELTGQLELCRVPLHGCCDQQLKRPLEEARRRGGQGSALQLSTLDFVVGLGCLLLPIVLLLRGGRGGRRVGGGSSRPTTRPAACLAVQQAHLGHTQARTRRPSAWRQAVEPQWTSIELQLYSGRCRTLGRRLVWEAIGLLRLLFSLLLSRKASVNR